MLLRRAGRIAVLEMHGVIGNSVRPAVHAPLLEAARRSRWVRAVVLDVDSPGGSATASHSLYQQVARVAAEKPVIAYISGVGASGGYYIACGATRIMAMPTALVGSIGVLSVRPVLEALLERLGVSIAMHKGGRLKDMGAFWRQSTSEEDAKLQEVVDDYYEAFIGVVAQGRKMAIERVRELATGEPFIAHRAKERGLVDELGDFDNVLDAAAQAAGIKRRVVYLRPRRPFLARFLAPMASQLADSLLETVEVHMSQRLRYWSGWSGR
ncbi:MAG: signal peptide peptidase SppA [Chloroflexi bacterium]|nr:signal peptide peptidase SppA [Chloroflexota bacterium]